MLRRRFLRILVFFGGVILSVILWDLFLPHIGLRALTRRTRPNRLRRTARRFRALAVEMGGVMIKVGQFMSARLDVMPREITDELAGLQDEVTPEKFKDIRMVLEAEFNASLESKYSYFEETPMASASIGQAHRARVRVEADGKQLENHEYPPVVVKVQRPNIESIVEIDLSALRIVSNWLDHYHPIRRRANVPALIEEVSRSIHEEMDYIQEGKNAETFKENFKDRKDVLVPNIYWDFTTRRVITLEDVQSIKITDYQAIEDAGIDRNEVASRLFATYIQQILEDRFFHADPHPGNLFVLPGPEPEGTEKRSWRLTFIDFGMVGELPERIIDGLREAIIAITTKDAARLVRADGKLHFLLPSADLDLLERAYSRVFESFWGKSTIEIVQMSREEGARFLDEFGQLLYDMPFQLPEDMILLGRCFSILSGMCAGLDPEFNIWTNIAPYAEKLVQEEVQGGWRFYLNEVTNALITAIELPNKIEGIILRAEQGKLEFRDPDLTARIVHLEITQRRLMTAILFTVFFLGGIQLYLAGDWIIASVLGFLALISLLRILFIRR
jgi:predicted unusual protein kinase regulating ubiquinone biosynthesis (AarF/ABC1/UbiB family)